MEKNNYLGNTTGERVKWLREYYGLSRKDLYEALKETFPGLAPSYTAIQGWELQKKQPRKNIISMLAKFFKCTESFLLCQSDIYQSNDIYSQKIQIEDLIYYDGKPVLLSLLKKDKSYYQNYALVNAESGYLIFKDQQALAFDKIDEAVEIYTIR